MTTSGAAFGILMTHPAIERELALLDPTTRADAVALDDLLHPDFAEVGASGQAWTRQSVIAALLADPGCSQAVREMAAVDLADGVALITYQLLGVRRSSIWVRDSGQWRIRYHQGTPSTAMSENR
ncbi:MAG: nuclear transport factor 2 family protein [Candidatus Nanopelagicales bacterium]